MNKNPFPYNDINNMRNNNNNGNNINNFYNYNNNNNFNYNNCNNDYNNMNYQGMNFGYNYNGNYYNNGNIYSNGNNPNFNQNTNFNNNACGGGTRINNFSQQYNNNGNNFNQNYINYINSNMNNGTCNNMMGQMNNDNDVYTKINMINMMNGNYNMNMINSAENIGGINIRNKGSNIIGNYGKNQVNNDNNMNKYKRLNIYLSIAKESLENPNNVNHELFKQYCKNESNPFQSNKITINLYDQSINNIAQLKITQKIYEDVSIDDVDKIDDEEKRTTIKIKGTKLAYKKGETIIETFDKFNMGTHEGQSLYDIVYQPILDEDNKNKFFVINFRKSEYIKDFDEAMRKYLSKNEPNNSNYKLFWYPKQGDKFRKYLEDKKEKKKPYKGFIKYL